MESNNSNAEAKKNFDISTLDAYETMMHDDLHLKGLSKENIIDILIAQVEGDFSQLSDGLRAIAEHPQTTESIKSTVTSEIISTHNSGMLAAMEFGYRECEKGNNLDMAFINFNKALKNK